jgi:hypothetical protein
MSPTTTTPRSGRSSTSASPMAPTDTTSAIGTRGTNRRPEQEQRDARQPDGQGRQVRRPERRERDRHTLGEPFGPVSVDPREVPDLAQPDDQARRGREPDDDGVADHLHDRCRTDERQHQVDRADQQGEHACEGDVPRRLPACQRVERGGGQQRDDRHRSEGEVGARADPGVGEQGDHGGVQAGDRWHPRERGVGHRLGHEHHGEHQARREVVTQPGARVAHRPPWEQPTPPRGRRLGHPGTGRVSLEVVARSASRSPASVRRSRRNAAVGSSPRTWSCCLVVSSANARRVAGPSWAKSARSR